MTGASHESRRQDRPIIFSATMVRALLDGRKTQTRRILKLPTKGEYVRPDMGGWAPTINGGIGVFTIGRDGTRHPAPETVGIWNQTTGTCLNAPWQIGDRLWVREACRAEELPSGADVIRFMADDVALGIPPTRHGADQWLKMFYYGGARGKAGVGRTVSPIHMPQWASRLKLTVNDVRVQRLQEISEEDAVAEGTQEPSLREMSPELAQAAWSERQVYARLWDALHGSDAWSANPWVVALTFTVEQRNIDALQEAA